MKKLFILVALSISVQSYSCLYTDVGNGALVSFEDEVLTCDQVHSSATTLIKSCGENNGQVEKMLIIDKSDNNNIKAFLNNKKCNKTDICTLTRGC